MDWLFEKIRKYYAKKELKALEKQKKSSKQESIGKECIVKDKCGVLIPADTGYIWVVAPFWDDREPVNINTPDVNVLGTIVLNNKTKEKGILPLTAFFAADSNIPMKHIYVTNKDHHHDWAPTYKDIEGVNALMTVKQLKNRGQIGQQAFSYKPNTDFIRLQIRDSSMLVFVGVNIFIEPEDMEGDYSSLLIIGSLDPEHINATVNTFFGFGKGISFISMVDWVDADNDNIWSALNHLGISIGIVGTSMPTNQK